MLKWNWLGRYGRRMCELEEVNVIGGKNLNVFTSLLFLLLLLILL